MEGETLYPTIAEVLQLYAATMEISPARAADGIRDLGLLESALARPQNAAAYEGASLIRQAATLLWGLISNHPFLDGNKRTAYVVTQAFLRANGATIVASEDTRFDLIVAIATGLVVDDVESWLGQHIAAWTQK